MIRFRSAFCVFFIALFSSSSAQPGPERSHWVFGKNAMLSFDNNGVSGSSEFKLNGYSGSACHSNKNGELVLATNGNAVYDGSGNWLGSITSKPESQGELDAVIIPINEEETRFYIFVVTTSHQVVYATVDIKTFLVEVSPITLMTGSCDNLTAVKHCFSDAYWLICSDQANAFHCFLVKDASVGNAIVSNIGANRSETGDLIASFQGDKLAVSHYKEHWVETFDFDKQCGKVSNVKRLGKLKDTDDYPHGLCFAPDGRSLYVAWSYAKSNLVQYVLGQGSIYNCYSSSENINDVEVGPDGEMYLNVHQNSIPSRRIHRLNSPNSFGGGARVTEDVASLPANTDGAFEFPNFIHCFSSGCDNQQVKDVLVTASDERCTDTEITFDATNAMGLCDSLKWNFDDPGNPGNTSTQHVVKRYFDSQRTYHVKCYLFYCDLVDTVLLEIEMKEKPVFDLGNDTIICADEFIGIGGEINFDSLVWNDGSHAPFRIARHGTYRATAYNGKCVTSDEIVIGSHPDIWTALEREYSICDLENETVKLDAGPGFQRYKWTPTGDTTQWIVVQQIGDYMVIVDAFTGCTGDGRTVVKRVCDMVFYVPNAFSPNNDNINDEFKVKGEFIENQRMSIFNRWGERIYTQEDPEASWQGIDHQAGVYFYQLEIEGFVNKKPITVRRNGMVHLMR